MSCPRLGRLRSWSIPLVVVACGPGEGEPIEDFRAPTCDQDGPVRLLPDVLAMASVQVGERLVVAAVDLIDGTPSDVLEAWSVGPCGEDPALLLEGEWRLRPFGDLLIDCDGNGGAHRIDPLGERPPVTLFQSVSCHFVATEAGLLAHDPVARRLLLHPSPYDGDAEAITLADGVLDPHHVCASDDGDCDVYQTGEPYAFQTDGASAYALDEQSRLLRIDLHQRTTTVVADAVGDFEVLPVADRLLLGGVVLDSQNLPPIRLVDLASGTERVLEGTSWRWTTIVWPLAMGVVDEGGPHAFGAFDLRTGDRIDVPEVRSFGISPLLTDPYVVIMDIDFSSGATRYHAWLDAQGRWIELASFESCASASQRNGRFEAVSWQDCDELQDGDLWLVDFEEGEPLLAATGISGPWVTRADRVAWSVGQDVAEVGDLLVVDLDDGHRWRIDANAHVLMGGTLPELDGDILYTVIDGDRTGLWRSALP